MIAYPPQDNDMTNVSPLWVVGFLARTQHYQIIRVHIHTKNLNYFTVLYPPTNRSHVLQECKRGAAILVAKSEARTQELLARLQLHEAKSTREILVAKNEVQAERMC